MSDEKVPRWLAHARELQSLGQIVRTYASSEYDVLNARRLTEMAAEITAARAELEREPLAHNFTAQPGYATPKVDVRAAVVRDARILLVQETFDRRWAMPGGWADVGVEPAAMIVRETIEESGFEVEPYRLVGVFDCNRGGIPLQFYHAYKLVMLCRITGGEARPSHETLAVDFFPFDDLPPLSRNRTNERHLDEVRAHLADATRPAAFD
jgi:ADP-ribose pyrophosphatase YjhB (NUDIX family)